MLNLQSEFLENMVPRRMSGPKRDEVTGSWRKLHNEGLHNLYTPPSTIMIKSMRIRWERHVARMGENKKLMGKPKEREH
jgi:hypothetical protein